VVINGLAFCVIDSLCVIESKICEEEQSLPRTQCGGSNLGNKLMFWVRKMFDEVRADIDRLLIQRFVSAKVIINVLPFSFSCWKKSYFCRKSSIMQGNVVNTCTDTYVWDDGYPRPTEQERIITFVSSCIESVAERLSCKVSEVYRRMERVGLIHDYIIPYYDTIHTESRENVTADIIETLEFWEKKKGVSQ
jgi:hypothetical protein